MKNVGGDAFITYHTLYYYFKILKISQKIKGGPTVNTKSSSQAGDIILDACMKFENYPIKTVRENAFTVIYIIQLFKISRNCQKYWNGPIVEKHKPGDWYYIDAYLKFENYLIEIVGENAFNSYTIL